MKSPLIERWSNTCEVYFNTWCYRRPQLQTRRDEHERQGLTFIRSLNNRWWPFLQLPHTKPGYPTMGDLTQQLLAKWRYGRPTARQSLSWLEINLVLCIDSSGFIPMVRLGSWPAPASYHNTFHCARTPWYIYPVSKHNDTFLKKADWWDHSEPEMVVLDCPRLRLTWQTSRWEMNEVSDEES